MSTPALAVCLAAYEPPDPLLRRQLASLRAQRYRDWVCLVQDDHSSPAGLARLRRALGSDRRFVLRRNPRRLGFYRNFEAALRRVPAGSRYAAFCDQDDRWRPEKLARGIELLERSGALLVHSDFRLVDARGRLLAPGNWAAGAGARADLQSLALANVVTGASAVFRAELLRDALPFPQAPGPLYHDHWLALVALSQGRLAYVPEALYDYVQHSGNSLGHGRPRVPARLGDHLRLLWNVWRRPRAHAPLLAEARREQREYLGRGAAYAAELQRRLGPRLKPGARAELRGLQRAEQGLGALALLYARGRWRRRDYYRLEGHLLDNALRLALAGAAAKEPAC